MQSISVKVNDSVQTIAEAKVITKDGQPTIIKANRNANYELINDATGRGPDHIVTKRVGKDLHISFEESAEESDLIIENFYDYDKSALIGQAESGQYHYYVPDTGLTQDYVTELVIGDIEGQALGGQGYPAPWWIGAEEGSRFGIMPWLVGIAGLAGIIAAVSDSDDDKGGNNNTAVEVEDKPLSISNLESNTTAQGAAQALSFTVTSDGAKVPEADISINGTILKDADGKTVQSDSEGNVTITAELLALNGITLGGLSDFTIGANKDTYKDATATLYNPQVVTMDGGVVVTPHETATKLEVSYTKPGETEPTTVTFTHEDTNGDGVPDTWVDDKKDDSITIDPATGKVVVPVAEIGSNTAVTAKQTTNVGTTNNSDDVGDIPSAKPAVDAIKTGDDAGDVVVKPSDDATDGSAVVVKYTDKDGNNKQVTITKDQDGWEADGDLPDGVVLDKDNGTVTIQSDNVTDGSDVTAIQTDPGRKESDPVSDKARINVPQPEITANDDGSVTVTPSDKADKVVINYIDEDGKPNTATITKDDNGNWTSDDDNVIINNDGTITLPDDKVKDGSEVSANQTVGDKDSDKGTVTTQDNVPQPEITANDDGSVTVTPSDKADKVVINYIDEDGKPNTATITKDDDGNWTSDDDNVVINNDGTITLPADKVKDGSTATAEQTVDGKDSDKVPVVANNENNTTPAKPASPEITANNDGSVTVTPSKEADKVVINYIDEDGKPNTATITKDDNGNWTSDDNNVIVNPTTGETTIPADKVKDGSTVTAQQTTPVGTSDPADATAKDGIAEPDVTANNDGSVTVKPADDATEVEISYVDEDGKEQTVTVTKDKDGNWTADDDNVVINDDGTITLPADKVKDGSDVTANQTTDNGKSGDASDTAGDARADAPTVTPSTTDGSVTATPGTDNAKLVVTYTDEDGKEQTVTINKDADGNWTAEGTLPEGVTVDKDGKVTIPQDAVKDESTVTAAAQNTTGGKAQDQADTNRDTGTATDPAIEATRNPDNSVSVKTEPNATVTDKDGNPITDDNGNPIVADKDGNATIPADKVPADNTIGAKDPAGNTATDTVDPADTTAPTVEATRNPDNSVSVKTEPNATVTDKDGNPITDDNGNPIVADKDGNATIPADKVPADNTIGAKDPAGNTATDTVDPADTTAPTVEATRNPDNSVSVKTEPNATVTDKDGNPITDDNGNPIVADKDGNATIPADKVPADNTIGAKDPAGNTATDTVDPADTTAPTVEATRNPDNSVSVKTEPNATVTDKDGNPITDDNGNPIVADKDGNATIPADKVPADNTIGAKDPAGNTATDTVDPADTTAPTVEATRNPDNSVSVKTEPNATVTDKDGNPITDDNGNPIVADKDGNATIPADKVPADNTIGAKDPAGNTATDTVDPADTTAPTVEATRNPDNSVSVKTEPNATVTDKDGNPITDDNGNPIVADKDGNATIPADKVPADNTIGAKDPAGNTATDTVDPADTTAPTVEATRNPDNSVSVKTEPNATVTDKDGNPITDDNGNPIVADKDGNATIPADKVPADNTIGAKDPAGNTATDTVDPADTTSTELSISVDEAEIEEGGTVTFIVTRTGDTNKGSSVGWTLTGSGDNPATVKDAESDFADSQATSGKLTFAVGEITKTITVQTKDDQVIEPNEGFTVTLSGATGATVTKDSESSVIKNNDKLVVKLESKNDSFSASPAVGSGDDKYTNSQEVTVSNIPKDVKWEYNIGAGWMEGEEASDEGVATITLPKNESWKGKEYVIEARIKAGQGYDVESTKSDKLEMTLDQVARVPTAINYKDGVLTGEAEAGAFIYNDQNGDGVYQVGEEFAIADDNGIFNLTLANNLIDYPDRGDREWDKIQASLGVIDKAGNTLDANKQGKLYYFGNLDTYDWFEKGDRTGGLVNRVHTLTDADDVVLAGGLLKGTYDLGDGNNSLVVTGRGLASGTKVVTGNGNDNIYLNRGMDGSSIEMGGGDDILNLTYVGYLANVDMGAGNDTLIVRRDKDLTSGNASNSIDGGEGVDTMVFDASNGNYTLDKITGFEAYDLTGQGANTLNITRAELFTNNSGSFIDVQGATHDSVIIVTGNGDDTVKWYGSSVSTGKVTYDNTEYDVYTDGQGNQLWVENVTVTGL